VRCAIGPDEYNRGDFVLGLSAHIDAVALAVLGICGSASASNSDSRTRVSRPILIRVKRPWVSHDRIVDGDTNPNSSAALSTE
jgi:hypothetical protein